MDKSEQLTGKINRQNYDLILSTSPLATQTFLNSIYQELFFHWKKFLQPKFYVSQHEIANEDIS